MVAAPSAGKSPALMASRRLIRKINDELKHQNLIQEVKYAHDLHQFEEATVAHKKAVKEKKTPAPLPPKPQKPPHLQLVVGNTTIEALAAALSANPRGVVAIHDELSSLLLNLNRYSGGSDRPLYIEAWAAAPWTINRKNLDKPIEIPRAAVNMLGGMQPEKLREFFDDEADDGLGARFLYTWPDPPTRVRLWERRGADDAWAALLTLLEWSASADPTPPATISTSALAGATRLWEEFFLPHARAVFRVGGRSPRELRLRKAALYLRSNRLSAVRRQTIRVDAFGRTLDAREADGILRSSSTAALSDPYIAQPQALDVRQPSGRSTRAFSINC
jgi:hypothetical protein